MKGKVGGKGNEKSGRKEAWKERQIIEGFKSLAPDYFRVVGEFLKSKNKGERLEACKLLKGSMEKFIPTIVQGDKDNPLIGIIQYPQKNVSSLETTPEAGVRTT